MKIVCIGDSLTFGYRVGRGECWVDILRGILGVEVINAGINGDTTAGILSRSFKDVVERKPSHVIIMGGSNDFLEGRRLNMVEENIEQLIKEALENNIIPVIGIQIPTDRDMAEIYWCNDADYYEVNACIREYRDWVLDYALDYAHKNKIQYIDFYKTFVESLHEKKNCELYIDGIHPSREGHMLMGNIAAKCTEFISK